MPNNRNAAKAMRQANKRRLRNRAVRTSLRTVIRKVKEAVTTSDTAAVESALKTATKKLDQAASKKFIHRNKAARLKSRLNALAKKPHAAKSPAAKEAAAT
jgi:small subunit ribosomal protein S20